MAVVKILGVADGTIIGAAVVGLTVMLLVCLLEAASLKVGARRGSARRGRLIRLTYKETIVDHQLCKERAL